MIEQSTIDEIRARANIVDIIDNRVKLKRAGKDYNACCPFHADKSPSFTVSEQKQFYYCYGCGAAGNVITFIMEYDGMSFPDAIKWLSDQLGITPNITISNNAMPRQIKDQLREDRMVIAIFDSDIKIGIKHNYEDTQRIKLARSRVEGIKRKWNLP